MTTGNAPTIDKVICHSPSDRCYGCDHYHGKADVCKYALEKPVPVEPFRRFRGVLKPVDRGMWVNGPCDYYHDAEVDTRIDSLQSALKLAQSQLPEEMRHCTILFEQCEKGHGHLRGDNWIKHDCLVCRAEKAEATNRRMVELMKRPPDEYLNISDIWSKSCDDVEGCHLGHPTQQHYFADLLHKAMSAELLKEIEK